MSVADDIECIHCFKNYIYTLSHVYFKRALLSLITVQTRCVFEFSAFAVLKSFLCLYPLLMFIKYSLLNSLNALKSCSENKRIDAKGIIHIRANTNCLAVKKLWRNSKRLLINWAEGSVGGLVKRCCLRLLSVRMISTVVHLEAGYLLSRIPSSAHHRSSDWRIARRPISTFRGCEGRRRKQTRRKRVQKRIKTKQTP